MKASGHQSIKLLNRLDTPARRRSPFSGTAEIAARSLEGSPALQGVVSHVAGERLLLQVPEAVQESGWMASSPHPVTPSLPGVRPLLWMRAGRRPGANLHLFNYSYRPPAMCLSAIYCAFQSPARHSGAFPACANGGE